MDETVQAVVLNYFPMDGSISVYEPRTNNSGRLQVTVACGASTCQKYCTLYCIITCPKQRPFENVNTDVVQFQGQILTRCVALNPRTRRPYTLQVQHKPLFLSIKAQICPRAHDTTHCIIDSI